MYYGCVPCPMTWLQINSPYITIKFMHLIKVQVRVIISVFLRSAMMNVSQSWTASGGEGDFVFWGWHCGESCFTRERQLIRRWCIWAHLSLQFTSHVLTVHAATCLVHLYVLLKKNTDKGRKQTRGTEGGVRRKWFKVEITRRWFTWE